MKDTFSFGLNIKLFQITPYVDDFPGSGQPAGASKKNSFTLHFRQKSSFIIIVVVVVA